MSTEFDFLNNPAAVVAPRLLGCILERTIGKETLRVRIVETEAYDQADAASHSFKGQTPRNSVMFGPAGHLYVYFTYGMHYCCNIVTEPEGNGSAVLIRAVEPLDGLATMESLRTKEGHGLTNGPAKLCQALAIDKSLNGHDLTALPLRLRIKPPLDTASITTTTRIGIRHGTDAPWRFYITDSPYVSKS